MKSKIILVFLTLFFNMTTCAKILGIFNMPFYSHFVLGESLLKELAKRGHEVTMMSPYGQKVPMENYRDIELVEVKESLNEEERNLDFYNFGSIPWMVKIFVVTNLGYKATEMSFKNEDLRKLIESDEKFDLIILETFINEAFFGFAHKFGAPVIIFATSGASVWVNRLTSNPSPASYIVNLMLAYSPNMSFFQRLNNLLAGVAQEVIFSTYTIHKHDNLMHKYFPDAPHLSNLIYNTSFVLLNSHPAQSAPLPLTPNMKEIGGFHIREEITLPGDIKKFLDDSKEGVVYFALGSKLKSANLPPGKLNAILEGLKRWKKPVLWKFENETLPGKPENVKIAAWLPQTAVLAHQNVKAFITHGGKLSIIESTFFGVPIIGIPIFGDQSFNVKQVEFAGYGLMLGFKSITADALYDSIVEITSNPIYSQRAKIRSEAMRSGPLTPMEEAIHWVEYIIKFKGADHLRSYGINLQWYQRFMVDLTIFVGLVVATMAWLLTYGCKKICKKQPKKQESRRYKSKMQ